MRYFLWYLLSHGHGPLSSFICPPFSLFARALICRLLIPGDLGHLCLWNRGQGRSGWRETGVFAGRQAFATLRHFIPEERGVASMVLHEGKWRSRYAGKCSLYVWFRRDLQLQRIIETQVYKLMRESLLDLAFDFAAGCHCYHIHPIWLSVSRCTSLDIYGTTPEKTNLPSSSEIGIKAKPKVASHAIRCRVANTGGFGGLK